jgi:hypothetical protein
MLDLKKIQACPVSVLRLPNDPRNYLNIPKHINTRNSKIIYSMTENVDTLLEDKNIQFITFEKLRDILLDNIVKKTQNVDFCSVLIVNDIHISTFQKLIIINLWVELFKNSTKRPYLIITCVSEYIPSLRFNIKKESFQDLFPDKDNRKFLYHSSNHHPNSSSLGDEICEVVKKLHREKIEESSNSVWLVFYDGKKDITKALHENLGDEVVILTEISANKLKAGFKSDRRVIVIVENKFFSNTLMRNIDCVVDSISLKKQNNFVYSSKEISDIRAAYVKNGTVYRLCTEKYYKDLPTVSIREYDQMELDRAYIKIKVSGLKTSDVFSDIIDESKIKNDMTRLENIGVFNGDKITQIGELVDSLSLKPENCRVIYDWYSSGKPVFPCLVACLISEIRKPLFEDVKSPNVFKTYLERFNELLKENKNLEDIELEGIERLSECTLSLKKFTDVSVGTYDTENLMKELIPLFEKAYLGITYKLINKNEGLYGKGDKIFKLRTEDFGYTLSKYPNKIFSFIEMRVNDNPSSLQKGKNYITYFAF